MAFKGLSMILMGFVATVGIGSAVSQKPFLLGLAGIAAILALTCAVLSKN
jgi:hypothetical protein